jgi:hypothetical protein
MQPAGTRRQREDARVRQQPRECRCCFSPPPTSSLLPAGGERLISPQPRWQRPAAADGRTHTSTPMDSRALRLLTSARIVLALPLTLVSSRGVRRVEPKRRLSLEGGQLTTSELHSQIADRASCWPGRCTHQAIDYHSTNAGCRSMLWRESELEGAARSHEIRMREASSRTGRCEARLYPKRLVRLHRFSISTLPCVMRGSNDLNRVSSDFNLAGECLTRFGAKGEIA